jgi:hypothetical protein
MKSLFSWSKLKSLNINYLEDPGNMFVREIVKDEVILWARESLCTPLFNIPRKTLEAYTTYTFWHKALGYSGHDLMTNGNVFSDGDLLSS